MAVYAHSRRSPDKEGWQELREHLHGAAALGMEFAPEAMKSQAYLAGLWHDVGKYQLAFQHYIGVTPEASNETNQAVHSVPHSAAGAALALERFGPENPGGLALALVIEAHHGALKSLRSIVDVLEQRGKSLLSDARKGGLPPALEETEMGVLPPPHFSAMEFASSFRLLLTRIC